MTIYTGDSSSSQLTVVPEAFLLKHHPTKSNVVPSSPFWTEIASESQAAPSISLKATRLISEGEELFVDYTHHLHSILPEWYHEVLPVLDDYEEATFLLHRSRQSIRDPPGPRGRQMSKQQSVVGQAMMLVTKVVERYRPAAAKLLVQALHGMSQYRGRADDANCLDLGLKSPTWKSLTQYGMCSTDIGHQLDGTTKLTRSKRPFLKGQKVHPIPVLLRQSKHGDCAKEDSSETCTVSSTASDFCWALPTTSLEACPLSSIDYLSSLLQVHKEANTPNVEIRWMKWEKVKTLAAYLQNEDEMTGPNDMVRQLTCSVTKHYS